jgi:serine/threonine protein kinase
VKPALARMLTAWMGTGMPTEAHVAKKLANEEFLRNLLDSKLLSEENLAATLESLPSSTRRGEELDEYLINAGKLTRFQADAVRERRFEELVIGNYQVLDRLGAGAMGTVYKARHRRMKRVVAIKVLSRSVGQSEKLVKRFQREVEAVARLSHPNIVMAFDADEAEVGHFLVMEFVSGRDLDSEVQKRGSFPIREAVDCIAQAGRGLSYAHEQGIIHRDIKPANLLRDLDGVVKVADLGLARFNDPFGGPTEEMAALTQAGSIMGTVDFMPPEQAMGLTNIDHRADIYSLGCTLYYLLLGCPPFAGASLMAILLKHREAPPPSLCLARQEIPSSLDAIFRRMVAKKPEERFTEMAEVVRALESLPTGSPTPPAPALQPSSARPATAKDTPARTMDTTPAGQSSPTVDLAPTHTTGEGNTVLLAEPSRSQAVIFRNYLQGLGFHVIATLSSGQKTLELARNAPPSVVVSTLHLNDMTGVELLRLLRADAPLVNVGFILISSEAEASDSESRSLLGRFIRLTKPFSSEQLAEALKAATVSTAPSSQAAEPDDAGNIRVLLVDDSTAARGHIRRVLASAGLRCVVEAKDGGEAVALLSKGSFDLVVTDYNMPQLDGRGVIDFIRNQSATPDVPVILVTTETDPAKLDAIRHLGVAAICDKSFPLDVIRQILKRREAGHV